MPAPITATSVSSGPTGGPESSATVAPAYQIGVVCPSAGFMPAEISDPKRDGSAKSDAFGSPDVTRLTAAHRDGGFSRHRSRRDPLQSFHAHSKFAGSV